jgi:hypothetical protein
LLVIFYANVYVSGIKAQSSVARKWNEVLLEAIRNDYARPTVHARNLFHTSIALYDMWAVYDDEAETYLLGKEKRDFRCNFNGIVIPPDRRAAREEAMSFAAYHVLRHRFLNSPGSAESIHLFDTLFKSLGFNPEFSSRDYSTNVPAALGNYMADCLIKFGFEDDSNEENDYKNSIYNPLNPPIFPELPGNPDIIDPNRWQPLSFDLFIDQSGNEIPFNTPEFLSPEWGKVIPFALNETDLKIQKRNGKEYWIYHDPGPPPYLEADGSGLSAEYIWGFTLVALWSSHLDPMDQVFLDISPASIGNISRFPSTVEGLRSFYDLMGGGDPGQGYSINPVTGGPYEPQLVPRGDYARVLAEFWADGPDSETPPGHWFTILNYVNDHPLFEKRYKGKGQILNDLEWDVKSYLVLGGAMHDAAISAWSVKGWYDYVRPISAIRYLADNGQTTDPDLPRYSQHGIPLIEGWIEMVREGDSLAGHDNEHVNKIKLYTWRGPDFIDDPANDVAGVGWILAENWWPYQRPTFVTPPFAGYVSGHSTFSRAAAEVLTLLTGDPFFPGGIGEFQVYKNEFLVFENGPSVDMKLQWATYRDASDQTSLSRIWGGIHPPADDIPGRIIGERVGIDAFEFADNLFMGNVTALREQHGRDSDSTIKIYPNPVETNDPVIIQSEKNPIIHLQIYNSKGMTVAELSLNKDRKKVSINIHKIPKGIYFVNIQTSEEKKVLKLLIK